MNISSKFLPVLLAGTVLSSPAAAVLAPAVDDIIEYTEGTAEDYNFIMPEADANGVQTNKYYKLVFVPGELSSSPNLSWVEVGEDKKDEKNVVAVNLPGNQVKYFQYTYQENDASHDYNSVRLVNLSGEVNADFAGIEYSNITVTGGAAYNSGAAVDNINGDFVNNSALSGVGFAQGGALYNGNKTVVGDINGNFIGNLAGSQAASVQGGAIYNDNSEIGTVNGSFLGNRVLPGAYYSGTGGAVYNNGSIKGINGNFVGNYVEAKESYVYGGAVFNVNTIGDVTGDFVNNHISTGGLYSYAYGGAVHNAADSVINNIVGNFINNYALSSESSAYGGAIYNNGSIKSVSGNFVGNHTSAANLYALGGAVYTATDMTFLTNGNTFVLSGNYTTDDTRNKNYNALFVYNSGYSSVPTVTFDTSSGGAWIINDSIEGGRDSLVSISYNYQYNLSFRGDDALNDEGRTTQYIAVNNDIINAGEVSVEGTTLHFGSYQHEDTTAQNAAGQGNFVAALNKDGSVNTEAVAVTSLSLTNAAFDIYNGYMDKVNLKGWSANNGYLHVDVDVANGTADVLNINGDVTGQTKVIVYAHSAKATTDKSILFATATGEAEQGANAFSVYRVYNSPYMFDVAYNPDGENGKEWSLTMDVETENKYAGTLPLPIGATQAPGGDEGDEPVRPTAPVYGEVVAYGALPAAALEQTRNMVDNIGNQIKNGRVYTRSCSFVDGYWDGEPYYNLWVNPTYYTSNIDSPFAIDADIWGIEAGGDIQHDVHNRLGIFVSYRQGEYDMDGNGDKYRSPVGSEIDIDSYIAGLYYRYDNNNWYAFATLYGGIQEADIKTDDGMKSDTDGVEFGASAEVGYDYALTDSVTLTPELGMFYTQVNYDDASDNVGKSASYDDARQIELEAGVKLAKTFMTDESFANVYVKPSVVQTIVDGDEVSITGLGDVEALDDATLGRIEIGGRCGFTTNLSAYGWANYTFGSDYDATTFGLGLNYAF